MAKVFGIHHLELKDDANAAEFEQIVSDELNALPRPPGWQFSIVKVSGARTWVSMWPSSK